MTSNCRTEERGVAGRGVEIEQDKLDLDKNRVLLRIRQVSIIATTNRVQVIA